MPEIQHQIIREEYYYVAGKREYFVKDNGVLLQEGGKQLKADIFIFTLLSKISKLKRKRQQKKNGTIKHNTEKKKMLLWII